jgi:hypothetical protein
LYSDATCQPVKWMPEGWFTLIWFQAGIQIFLSPPLPAPITVGNENKFAWASVNLTPRDYSAEVWMLVSLEPLRQVCWRLKNRGPTTLHMI